MRPRENETGEPRAAGAGTGADPRTAGMTSGGAQSTAGAPVTSGTSSPAGPAADTGERALPAPGFAEVSIVAATPEAARRIAQVLRFRFAATERPGQPAQGESDGGTRLHLTVDTVHFPDAGPFQLRLVGGEEHARDSAGVSGVTDAGGTTDAGDVTPPVRPPRPAPNTRFALPPTPDDPSGDRPTP